MGARQKVLACFLLLVFHGRNEAGAAPSQRERRDSKSQNDNFANFQQQQIPFQSRQFQSQQQQQLPFQQGQSQSFQPTPQQTPASFPDVFNSQQQQFQPAQFAQQQDQPFQTKFSQQQPPFRTQQGFQSAPQQPNQFNAAQQSSLQPLSSGPGSGRSLFDQIVNKINSGHRQKSRRKQGSNQQQPQNRFSNPTLPLRQSTSPQSPSFPDISPSIPKTASTFFWNSKFWSKDTDTRYSQYRNQ